jgi:hypothetical protein
MSSIPLQFQYLTENEKLDESSFFEEEGSSPFDANSKTQMQVMMKEISKNLNLKDEYSIKKLEMILKYELPTFTATRRLVKNWMLENFIF